MREDYSSERNSDASPDQARITTRQAQRISKLARVSTKEVEGLTVAEAAERFKWRVDPGFFFFRRICGRVVKTNPSTGVDEPVPFATVHVEDTDCSFLGLFPVESPFWWFFPVFCHREEIGTTHTDACGNFCVYIPRFEIDWLLRFRLERYCYLDLFRKPTLAEVLKKFHAEEVDHQRIVHGNPNPPDPSPVEMLRDARVLRRIEDAFGRDVAMSLARTQAGGGVGLGQRTTDLTTSLDKLAYRKPIPPPRVAGLREVMRKEGHQGVAGALGLSGERAERYASLDFNRAVGPFWRCEDVITFEWVPFFDVPDITFRVTQDIDGDGTEETVYSEGFFDVRWNAGDIPDVTLHANPLAVSTPNCDPPPNVGPCATPGLVLVGNMPLINPSGAGTFPYVDTTNGYAVRPNRPHDSGRTDQVAAASTHASAPLGYVLDFYGCNHRTSKGVPVHFYKVLRETSLDDGATWSPPVPVYDSWMLFRSVGSPPVLEWRTITASASGWYPVVNPGEGWVPSENLILQWHQAVTPNGFHRLSLELGDAGKNHLETTDATPIRVDNSGVQASFYKLEYRLLPGGSFQNLGFNCPVIHRQGHDVEVRVTAHVTADHLRSVHIAAAGCGDGNTPVLVTGFEAYQSGVPAGTHTSGYWHKSRNDNNFSNDANPVVYRIDSGFSNGAYTFSLAAYSRAFYPGDGHVYDPTHSDTDYNPVIYGSYPYVAIAVVD